MDYGSQTTTQDLLSGIARGFRQTPIEIVLSFLIIIAFLLLISLYFLTQRRRAHRELASRSREMLEHLLGKLDLNEQQTALLGRIALYRDRHESEHTLLVNRSVFDECARKMALSEEVPEASLEALRLKIGFSLPQAARAPASSAELPVGSPVIIVGGAGRRLHGTIVAQEAGAIHVKLVPGSAPPENLLPLTLYFHNSTGIFSFVTKSIDRRGEVLYLAHSSEITHYQRREFYRRKEFLPVFVKLASASGVAQETYLLDLGGGGSSFQNPRDLALQAGDIVELSFSSEKAKFTLAARVIRISKIGKVVNVKFQNISETERRRIMSFLVTQSERRGISPR